MRRETGDAAIHKGRQRGCVRGLIYDAMIRPLTTRWYREVLARLPAHSRLLDIGIGTGGALVNNAALVRQKDLYIQGVDIDPDYVERARKLVSRVGLERNVDVRLESIYDHQVEHPYDAIYFSASFMLLPDPAACLEHVRELVAPCGKVFFTQTFQDKPSKLMEKAKPMLHKVTTIQFGAVTYESDFLSVVEDSGMQLDEMTTLDKTGARSYRLAVGHFPMRAVA
jgi:tRNA A58 N-methylase Trm61